MRSVLFPGTGKILVKDSNGFLFDAIEIQSVEFDVGIEAQSIDDGNSMWELMKLYTKRTGSIKVSSSLADPKTLAVLWGATYTAAESFTAWQVGEEATVPSTGPYTVTLAQTPSDPTNSLFVRDIDGNLYTKAAATPGANEFSISGNTVTFNSAAAGKAMVISYAYTLADATTIKVTNTGEPSPFQIIHQFAAKDRAGAFYDCFLNIPRLLTSGNMPVRVQKEAQPIEFTANIQKPDGGLDPLTFAIKKRVA